MTSPAFPPSSERVLSTLDLDGQRRWLNPRPSHGRWYRRRFVVAWTLIAVFTLMPIIHLRGKPLMLLDVKAREFTLFGVTFLPTDTFLLLLALLSIFVSIFLITALFGRAWCGWACPQTVYLEFVYRPLERLIEGITPGRAAPAEAGPTFRKALKLVAFAVISAVLANTFLAYFVGWERLLGWMTSSPFEHPAAFAVMLTTWGLMLFDFSYFREQTCIVACPYGRLQSVLLDPSSLVVGYDRGRGEPRGRLRRGEERTNGDCIDCGKCVRTCPTGIDIRDGLQMECVACTQCVDACDEVMRRIGLPTGLVRYTSQRQLQQGRSTVLRPRLFVYAGIIATLLFVLALSLSDKASADVTVLRGLGSPFSILPSGEVSNQIRLKITNRSDQERAYSFSLVGAEGVTMIAPENPLVVAAGSDETTAAFFTAPPSAFTQAELRIQLEITDGVDFSTVVTYRLLGPEG